MQPRASTTSLEVDVQLKQQLKFVPELERAVKEWVVGKQKEKEKEKEIVT